MALSITVGTALNGASTTIFTVRPCGDCFAVYENDRLLVVRPTREEADRLLAGYVRSRTVLLSALESKYRALMQGPDFQLARC